MEQGVLAADAAAAALAAHRARAGTATLLGTRLADQLARAQDLGLPLLGQRASDLQAALEDLLRRSAALQVVVDGEAQAAAARVAELMAQVSGPALPAVDDLLAAEAELVERRAGLAPLIQKSDDLVRELTALTAAVEDIQRGLIATGLPQAEAVPAAPVAPVVDLAQVPVVELVTDLGTLVLELRPDAAPRHVQNFTDLVARGFYDGLTFHRVVPGFLVQGGCPRGDGSGGPGHSVAAEPNGLSHERGALSMARFAHPDSAGSQFFITLQDWSRTLDGHYTVFGRLLAGQAVLDAIAARGSESGVPDQPVRIQRAVVRPRGPADVADPPAAAPDGR